MEILRFIHSKRKIITTILVIIFFSASLTAYFKFGLYHLNQFETADEHLWISNLYTGRIQAYWNAAAKNDWPDTWVNDKPGVSLAIISALGGIYEKNVDKKILNKENLYTITNPEILRQSLFLYRLPLVIFNGLMSIFYFIYFWRLTKNKWLALTVASLIQLCPILLGISQIINPDTLLWSTSFGSILSFWVYMRTGRFVDIFFAGLFLGLALLSKYVALILVPFYLMSGIIYLFFEYENLNKEEGLVTKKLRQLSLGYLGIIIIGFGIFALLMPALLVDLKLFYKSTLDFKKTGTYLLYFLYLDGFILIDALFIKGFFLHWLFKKLQFLKYILPRLLYGILLVSFILIIVNWSLKNNFLDLKGADFGENISETTLNAFFLKQIFPQITPLIFSLTPIVLFFMLFLWAKSLFCRSIFDYLVFSLSLFLVIYYAAMIKQNILLNYRYSIILYPIAITLASIGFYELVSLLRLKEIFIISLILIVIFVNGLSLWKIKPFYFNYSSELLPKNFSFAKSWGYGGYEAAEFISSQGDPAQMTVWSDYMGFCSFYKGKCLIENAPKWASQKMLSSINYYVISYQGQQKNSPSLRVLNDFNPNYELVWELNIDDRPDNFVKIYKNKMFK